MIKSNCTDLVSQKNCPSCISIAVHSKHLDSGEVPEWLESFSSSLITIWNSILFYNRCWNQSIITAVAGTWVAILFPAHIHVTQAGRAISYLLLPMVLTRKPCLLKTRFCCNSKCKASPWHQSWQWRLLERAHALFRHFFLVITGNIKYFTVVLNV